MYTEIRRAEFSLRLPGREWTDHSTQETYDFRIGEKEQLTLALHLTLKRLSLAELQAAVIEMFRIRLDVIQKHSGNSCTFESPTVRESLDRFDTFVFGLDQRGVFMQLAFFGTPQKILICSYYDYSGAGTLDNFKARASEITSSVQLK